MSATPHGDLCPTGTGDRFLADLFDRLWQTYCRRVRFVPVYLDLLTRAGGRFVNDHIAFRTLATQNPYSGIASISRLFEALGYEPRCGYRFPDKHVSAVHFEHPRSGFPRLFISELQTWKLSPDLREPLCRVVAESRPTISDDILAQLSELTDTVPPDLLQMCVDAIDVRPWSPPPRDLVVALNQTSQYAAWVLAHGNRVNHFTAFVNAQQALGFRDLSETVATLTAAGIPMKQEIEGLLGSPLRQTATSADVAQVEVLEDGKISTLEWPYAYFELAERAEVTDPLTGSRQLFSGFLGPQATQLFEQTRR